MENFNKIKNIVEENSCNLLTTFEEFEEKRDKVLKKSYQYVRIGFVGVCGHNSSAVVTNFITRKTGIKCKDCVKKSTICSLKIKNKEANKIESQSISIIERYLLDTYEVIRTKEGCRADLILKNKINTLYIPVQVKSTNNISSHKMYSFRCINKNYDDMIIVCICTSEEKIWVIPYDDIKHLNSLNISIKSKYNKYLVENNLMLYKIVENYSDKYCKKSLIELNTPLNILQKREQEYVNKRETFINFLEYTYPDIQNTSTDFIVNGKKVQEKVAGIRKDRNNDILSVYLASNNGKKNNGVRKFRTYMLGENNYYWIHSSIDSRFWIIPENILYDKGYLAKADETLANKVIYISNKTQWITYYEYNYNNINKENIEKIFK
jgi:hypothetical protein